MSPDLARRAEAEVVERHRFFVEWFTGRAPDAAMDASARAFAPDMRMVEPDGVEQDQPAVVAMLRSARGKRPADFEIRVVLHATQAIGPDTVIVTYDEHQRIGDKRTARRSSAVLTADAAAPEGVVWRFLQETWIADPEAP